MLKPYFSINYFIFFLSLNTFCVSNILQDEQYTLKAAYLERFTRLIDWPEGTGFADTSKPFILAVIGENPFGSILEGLADIKKIKEKKIKIQYYNGSDLNPNCNLLFISKSEYKNIERILSITKNRPILTIGDTKGYCEKGVHINLYFDKNKLSYEVNENSFIQSRLSASYLLLMTAKVIRQNHSNN